MLSFVLWIIGVALVIAGIRALARRQLLIGIVDIVLGMAIGGFGFFAS